MATKKIKKKTELEDESNLKEKVSSEEVVEELKGAEISEVDEGESETTIRMGDMSELQEDTQSGVKGGGSMFTTMVVLTLLIMAVTGWMMYVRSELLRKSDNETAMAKIEELAKVTPTPEPTPEQQLSREEITLEILNGSGTAGLAGDTKDDFEKLGYVVSEVGNADDVVGNELYVKKGYESRVEKLVEDVKDQLDIVSITGELDTDASVVARIVLGE